MSTLYDVLGVSEQATAEQIEHAHRFCLDKLGKESTGSDEQDMIRARAIREAHSILSSSERRANYDRKLRQKRDIVIEVVEAKPTPWLLYGVLALALLGGGAYYRLQTHKAEVERVALEAQKAKVEAEAAAKLAEVEQARLERQRSEDNARADLQRQRNTEIARREGERIHYEMQAADRERLQAQQNAERQARYDQQREEALAQQRLRQQTYDMQRALAIPVRR